MNQQKEIERLKKEKQGKIKEAEKIYLNLKKNNPNFKLAYLNLSSLYFSTKNIEKGIVFLEKNVKLFPNFFPFYYDLAVMYRNKGKIDMAVKNLLISININKFYFRSYFELSSISDLSEDKEKLSFLLNLDFDKLNIQDKIDVSFTISNIYHQQKNFDKSIKYLN